MIKKKKCPNCDSKIKNSPNFCPNCGIQLKEIKDEWGMLGKSDKMPNLNEPNMLGNLPGGMLNKMLGSAMKMLEKELQKEMGNQKNPSSKIKLMINGKEINPTKQKDAPKKENERKLPIDFTAENLEKWTVAKKEIPKTNLKRIDDKIQYELEVPGVETIKDVSIIKLEESLEVRAIAKEKAYQKNIPINLPLRKYSLLREKLTLELDASM